MELEDIARRIAPAREAPVELLAAAERAHGATFAEELRGWVRLFERFELETIEPSYAELRAPDASVSLKTAIEVDDASCIAGVVGLFTGTTIIAQQDELSYLAAWVPSQTGLSKVFHFHPDDWGLWPTDPALVVRLFRLLQDDKGALKANRYEGEEGASAEAAIEALRDRGRHEHLDVRLDPARLFPRVTWLVHLFLGHGGDWKSELAQAATIRDWDAERALVREHPQLALYWLWSHSMFGNGEELEDVLASTADSASALVLETRELIARLEDGREVRLGARSGSMFEAFREQLQDQAPAAVLGSRAKERRDARERAQLAAAGEEEHVLDGLRAIGEREPKVKEALALLEWLKQGGALRPAALRAKMGLTPEEAVEKFASLVDHRFRSLVLIELRQSARWVDASPHATQGMLLAFAKLAKGFDELDSVVRAMGTGNFGARRQAELHKAYGCFDDDRATAKLVELTRLYLDDVESWDPKTPSQAFVELLARDVPETHASIAAFLEKASFSGANAAVALRAVEAAGRLKSKAAVRGLERAVERELGRIDDGSRARVIAALVACAGRSCLPFLRGLYAARLERWENEADRDASYAYHHKDIACWMSGMLPLAPKDAALIAKSREMLARFLEEMGPGKKPRKDVIYAVAALLRGAGNGRVTALRDAVAPYATVELREDRATLGLGEMVTKLAGEVLARL